MLVHPLPQTQLENHGDVHIYVLVGFRKPQQQREKTPFRKEFVVEHAKH